MRTSTKQKNYGIRLYSYFKYMLDSCLLFAFICANAANAAVILQYHHVSNTSPHITSVATELFEAHLKTIEEQEFQVWSLVKLIDHVKNKKPVPDKVVVITFDDAYQSIYEEAFPLLAKRGWPFTLFVATNPVDQKAGHFLSWEQIRTMAKQDASIANHTLSHTHLVRQETGETKEQWLQRIRLELTGAEKRIEEEVGVSVKQLAYPYGEYTGEIQKLVEALGFVAFGQQSGAVDEQFSLTALPRFPMNNEFGAMDVFKTKLLSLPFPASRILPKEHVIEPGGNGVMQSSHKNQAAQQLKISFFPVTANVGQVACYLSGKGKAAISATQNELNEISIILKPFPDLLVGRSRLNCTVPSLAKGQIGRFYWFSHFWMRPMAGGEWYPEP